MYDNFKTTLKGTGLKIAHINCCGIWSLCSFDILGITESHLNDKITDEEIHIEGYKFFRRDRQHKAGGCLVYYKEHLNVIPKLELTTESTEALWLEMINSQGLLIGKVYLAPDNNAFYNDFKRILEQLWLKRKNMLITGDFNSDLLKTNKDRDYQGKKLVNITRSFGLTNVIKDPTRISKTSETLLDLIIVTNEPKIRKAGTLDPALSDHKLIYAIVQLKRRKERPVIKIAKNYKNVDKNKFELALQNVPWWICNVFDDLDYVQNTWELLYKDRAKEFITDKVHYHGLILQLGSSRTRDLNS